MTLRLVQIILLCLWEVQPFTIKRDGPQNVALDIAMPGASPSKDEEYLCYGQSLRGQEGYVVKFIPIADADRVHHLLLYGCDEPGFENNIGNCEMAALCKSGTQQILYAWAKNAPPFDMPDDVGVHLGGNSNIRGLVLQIHYASKFAGNVQDYSGVRLEMSSAPPKYLAGVHLFAAAFNIPPNVGDFRVNMSCENQLNAPATPFAYRTHAHGLGVVISAYFMRNNQWTMIGKGNPQLPQRFYTVQRQIELHHGDMLAAQCVFNSTERSVNTHQGMTNMDEMCNFYMYYYQEADKFERSDNCPSPGDPALFASYPAEGAVPLPPDPMAEMHAHHIHSPFGNDAADRTRLSTSGGGVALPYYSNDLTSTNPRRESMDTFRSRRKRTRASRQQTYTQSRKKIGPTRYDDGQSFAYGVDSQPAVLQSGDYGYGADANSGDPQVQVVPLPANKPVVTSGAGSGVLLNKTGVSEIRGWPAGASFGQIGGLAIGPDGMVYVFHRASRSWTADSFDDQDRFTNPSAGAIPEPTLAQVDPISGQIVKQWGAGIFYMPHGIHVDAQGNVWVTDVALHQVFKFSANSDATNMIPALELGKALKPGKDDDHFCKPSAVVVGPEGNIYVADGYCNSRIMKFSPNGTLLMQWGSISNDLLADGYPALGTFAIPHALALDATQGRLFVADRENGRVQAFHASNGSAILQIHPPEFGDKVFSVAFADKANLLYVVNGPNEQQPNQVYQLKVFVINPKTGQLLYTFQPRSAKFKRPHALAAGGDGHSVYVGELDPTYVWQFNITMKGPAMDMSMTRRTDNGAVPTTTAPSAVSGANDRGPGLVAVVGKQQSPLQLMFIVAAAVLIPVLLIVLVCMCIRFRKQGGFRRLNQAAATLKQEAVKNGRAPLLNGWSKRSHKGFQPLNTEDVDAIDDLSDESDNDDTLYPVSSQQQRATRQLNA